MAILKVWVMCAVLGMTWGCSKISLSGSVPVVTPLDKGQIAWRDWSSRDSALVLNKPTMLFLYSPRSLWCRDQVAQAFGHAQSAQMVNQFFLPIWANVDVRPDLFERYGLGGVPSVVFLTPDGRWLTGSTYMDFEDFQDLMRRIFILFENAERMETLESNRSELLRYTAMQNRRAGPAPLLNPALVGRVIDSMQVAVARGEDIGPEGLLALVLTETAHVTGVDGLKQILARRRDRDGTFFLCELTPDGVVVDREKHLAVNARWLMAFAQAVQPDGAFRDVVEDLGVALVEQFGVPNDSLLCAGRAGFKDASGYMPYDLTIISGWNGLAVSGLVAASHVTRERKFWEAGRRIMNGLVSRFRRSDGLFGRVDVNSSLVFLEDQVLIARAALDMFDAGKQDKDLKLAQEIVDGMLRVFANDSGALRDRNPDPGAPVISVTDRWTPSGNGVAAQVLVRLATHTGQTKYQRAAQKLLRATMTSAIPRVAYAGAWQQGLVMYLATESKK